MSFSLEQMGIFLLMAVTGIIIIVGGGKAIINASSDIPIDESIRSEQVPSGEAYDDKVAISWFDNFADVVVSYTGTDPKNHGCFLLEGNVLFNPVPHYYWDIDSNNKGNYQLKLVNFEKFDSNGLPEGNRVIKVHNLENVKLCAVAGNKKGSDFPSQNFLNNWFDGSSPPKPKNKPCGSNAVDKCNVENEFRPIVNGKLYYTGEYYPTYIEDWVRKFGNFIDEQVGNKPIPPPPWYNNLYAYLDDGKIEGNEVDSSARDSWLKGGSRGAPKYARERNLFFFDAMYIPKQGNICFIPFEDDEPSEGIDFGDSDFDLFDFESSFYKQLGDWNFEKGSANHEKSDFICEPKFAKQDEAGKEFERIVASIKKCTDELDDSYLTVSASPVSFSQDEGTIVINDGTSATVFEEDKPKKKVRYEDGAIQRYWATRTVYASNKLWFVSDNKLYVTSSTLPSIEYRIGDMLKEELGLPTQMQVSLKVLDIAKVGDHLVVLVKDLSLPLQFEGSTQKFVAGFIFIDLATGYIDRSRLSDKYLMPNDEFKIDKVWNSNEVYKIVSQGSENWYVLDRYNQKITEWDLVGGKKNTIGLGEVIPEYENRYQIVYDAVKYQRGWYFLTVDGKKTNSGIDRVNLLKVEESNGVFKTVKMIEEVSSVDIAAGLYLINNQVIVLQRVSDPGSGSNKQYNFEIIKVLDENLERVYSFTKCSQVSSKLPAEYSIEYGEYTTQKKGYLNLKYKTKYIRDNEGKYLFLFDLDKQTNEKIKCLCVFDPSTKKIIRDCNSAKFSNTPLISEKFQSRDFYLVPPYLCISSEVSPNAKT